MSYIKKTSNEKHVLISLLCDGLTLPNQHFIVISLMNYREIILHLEAQRAGHTGTGLGNPL